MVQFTKLNAEALVTIGGAVVYNLDFYVPFGSVSDYRVSFTGENFVSEHSRDSGINRTAQEVVNILVCHFTCNAVANYNTFSSI